MPIVFPGFRTKALTFSYDDGTLQDRRLAALFRKYGLKATFNLNSGAFDEVQHGSHGGFSVNFSRVHAGEVRDLYASFEVASHTLTHPILTDIPDEEIRRQVIYDDRPYEDRARDLLKAFEAHDPDGVLLALSGRRLHEHGVAAGIWQDGGESAHPDERE